MCSSPDGWTPERILAMVSPVRVIVTDARSGRAFRTAGRILDRGAHMENARTIPECRALIARWRREGKTVGFVPTMGYLHEGHLSLVRRAKQECDRAIASVFVNPTQFGPSEDLSRYPRDLEGDTAKLASAGCDALFTTTPEEMYP